jgi:hypothetical protein
MVETIKSKNPCPFCGKKKWIILSFDSDDEIWYELLASHPCLNSSNIIALVDFDMKVLETYEAGKNSSFDGEISEGTTYVDECASCGALIQG